MGHSHYCVNKKTISKRMFGKIAKDCKTLCNKLDKTIQIRESYENQTSKPIFNDTEILFNGVDDERHEDFWLTPEKGYSDCKTAMKPYDLLVMSSLIAFKVHAGSRIKVTSDGDFEEWKYAIEFVNDTLKVSVKFEDIVEKL